MQSTVAAKLLSGFAAVPRLTGVVGCTGPSGTSSGNDALRPFVGRPFRQIEVLKFLSCGVMALRRGLLVLLTAGSREERAQIGADCADAWRRIDIAMADFDASPAEAPMRRDVDDLRRLPAMLQTVMDKALDLSASVTPNFPSHALAAAASAAAPVAEALAALDVRSGVEPSRQAVVALMRESPASVRSAMISTIDRADTAASAAQRARIDADVDRAFGLVPDGRRPLPWTEGLRSSGKPLPTRPPRPAWRGPIAQAAPALKERARRSDRRGRAVVGRTSRPQGPAAASAVPFRITGVAARPRRSGARGKSRP